MPRSARIVIPHAPHHVTQRGNNRQDVFFVDDDRRAYLDLLRERCMTEGVDVLGYCLMSNHVHLVVTPPSETALSRAVGRTHFAYTQYVNRLHGRSGHLWQGRFYSCPLDETHLWRALAYVERNPVRARLVRRAWRWPWSSAAAHAGVGSDATGLLDMDAWLAEWKPRSWQAELTTPTDDAWRRSFWRAVRTGRPSAEDSWISKLEAQLGRRLRANPVGRPRRSPASKPKGRRTIRKRAAQRARRPAKE